MAVSGVNAYTNALYQWQGQKLNSTGNGASSSASKAASALFEGTSMTNQLSSMVELTKYAMNAMGLSDDSRVTFNQITKYANQLQSEFNTGVKEGFANSGITNLSSLIYTMDSNGKITVSGGTEADRQKAQAWLDANPSYGETIRAAVRKKNPDSNASIQFTLSSTGKMSVINKDNTTMQSWINEHQDLAESLREGINSLEKTPSYPLEFTFDGDILKVKGEDAAEINKWLENNPGFSAALKSELEKNNIQPSSVTLRLGSEGLPQITVRNAELEDIQAGLDAEIATGAKIYSALDNLGIDPNVSFSIQIGDDGKLNIVSDHPDRDKIQRFFEEHPELVKKYQQIETLAGIEDARKAMQVSPSAMRKRIQIESMASWWADSGNANSYFGSYSSQGLSLLAGLNLNV